MRSPEFKAAFEAAILAGLSTAEAQALGTAAEVNACRRALHGCMSGPGHRQQFYARDLRARGR